PGFPPHAYIAPTAAAPTPPPPFPNPPPFGPLLPNPLSSPDNQNPSPPPRQKKKKIAAESGKRAGRPGGNIIIIEPDNVLPSPSFLFPSYAFPRWESWTC
ncbi:hypothetical protein IscW_ISCW022044, partial [Ixodes scapularis]